jgi:hypothetical protein
MLLGAKNHMMMSSRIRRRERLRSKLAKTPLRMGETTSCLGLGTSDLIGDLFGCLTLHFGPCQNIGIYGVHQLVKCHGQIVKQGPQLRILGVGCAAPARRGFASLRIHRVEMAMSHLWTPPDCIALTATDVRARCSLRNMVFFW